MCCRRSGSAKTGGIHRDETETYSSSTAINALPIRLPESLHERVRQLADEEGISLNQFVMLAVAETVTRLDEGQSLASLDALEQVGKTLAEEEGQTL